MSGLTQFGAVADARQVYPLAAVAGSPLVIAGPGTFSEADVGKRIVVAGAGAGGAKLATTIASFVDGTTVSLANPAATSQAATGASLGTDCSAALQAALDSLADNGGGELLIDGDFLLTAPVYKNFHTLASSIVLRGTGSNSALLIACGATQSAITVGNLIKLSVEYIDFVGTPGERNDAKIVLDLQTCLSVDLQGNSFYGLSNVDSAQAAVINNYGGGLTLARNNFGGCLIANGGVVLNNLWQRFSSVENRFIDFGQRNGILHSKTYLTTGQSWIAVGDPVASTTYETNPQFVYPHAFVRIEGDFYDEGTKNPLLIYSPAKLIAGARISGCRFNVNAFTTETTGPAILNVADVSIEHCSMGYCNASRYAIYLNTVRHARITGVVTNGIVNILKAYTIERLEIVNSPTLTTLDLTNVAKHSVNGVAP